MAKDSQSTSTDLQTSGGRTSGLVAAFHEVTDDVVDLAKTHLDLARAEARHDVKVYGKDTARAGVGLGFAFLGFGFVNLAAVCFAGWMGGLGAMALSALVLGSVYTFAGLRIARTAVDRMKEREGALRATKKEIKRSSEWVKEIRESS